MLPLNPSLVPPATTSGIITQTQWGIDQRKHSLLTDTLAPVTVSFWFTSCLLPTTAQGWVHVWWQVAFRKALSSGILSAVLGNKIIPHRNFVALKLPPTLLLWPRPFGEKEKLSSLSSMIWKDVARRFFIVLEHFRGIFRRASLLARDYAWGHCLSFIHVGLSYVLDLCEWLVLYLSLWISFLWKNTKWSLGIAVYLTMASLTLFMWDFLIEVNELRLPFWTWTFSKYSKNKKSVSFLYIKHSNNFLNIEVHFNKDHAFCVHVDNSFMKIYFMSHCDGLTTWVGSLQATW